MKTKVMFLAVALTAVLGVNAQNQNGKGRAHKGEKPAMEQRDNKGPKGEMAPKGEKPSAEQMAERKANKMAEQLLLDDKTSAKFVPLYQQYLTELQALKPAKKQPAEKPEAGKAPKVKKNKTEQEIADKIKANFERQHKTLDIKEKYYKEFSKVLNQKQISKMYKMEKNSKPGKKMGKKPGMRPMNVRNMKMNEGGERCPMMMEGCPEQQPQPQAEK